MPERRSKATDRLQSAAVRAMDSHIQVSRAAKRVTEELDEVTSPGAFADVELSEENSVVTVVQAAITAHSK